MTPRLYGIAELAAALGVAPNTVAQWYRRGKLLEPDEVLAMGPVWKGARIERWLEERRERRV